MSPSFPPDAIDRLVGLGPDHGLAAIRLQRPQARLNSQQSYEALFEPASSGMEHFSLAERFAVALFVVGLHGPTPLGPFYTQGLVAHGAAPEVVDALTTESGNGLTTGPCGRFPPGPLSIEDTAGPVYRVSGNCRAVLGERLAAALAHAHLLVFHPRDARASDLQALLDAGWSTTGIVTLSQLVAFLSFQVRVVVGLRAMS